MSRSIRNALPSDLFILADIIRNSFKDVAIRFGLTEENCPKHPSNCTPYWIRDAFAKGVFYFILEQDGTPCGCVALEHATPEVCYMERLAVLPQMRRSGMGAALVAHAMSTAQSMGSSRIEIGIISADTELKMWYRRLGFAETRTAIFPHLPFEVSFMARELGPVY